MFDLSGLSLISFEICSTCNLQHVHKECPVNKRNYVKTYQDLDIEIIVDTIKRAQNLNFKGMIAFHYYNEPFLKLDKILKIIKAVPSADYLVWTNGLLLDRNPKKNEFLKLFKCVCITCYNEKNMPFFNELKRIYKNVEIFDWELDNRLEIYNSTFTNVLACKRPLFEIPIDFHGNIHLCCMDWNNQYQIGNIFEKTLDEIVKSDIYQNLIKISKKRLLDKDKCPAVCRGCDKVWVSYPKNYDINLEES